MNRAARGPHPQLARIRSNVAGVRWPPISAGAAATVAALLRSLDETQWLTADELRGGQYEQLRVLARQFATTSPSFRARLDRGRVTPDDLGTPDGLRRLPPLTRRELQGLGDALFAVEVPKGHEPVQPTSTSGSTGEPVVVRRTAVSGVMWSAMTLRDHLWRELDFGWRIAVHRPTINADAERTDWGTPVTLLFESGPCRLLPTALSIDDLADRLIAFSPHVLVVYPTVLGAVIDRLDERGVGLPDLRYVHTVAETLSPALRERAGERLGAGIWDTYSSQELGNIATQCATSESMHVMAESVLVEVVDEDGGPCGPGEIGRVVATDLHNLATPLVRYDIGDYAEVGEPCPCGRGLPTLRRVLGRERNLVVLPDGSRHWPMVGFHRFGEIAPIRQYQLVQRDRDVIEVRMVATRAVSPEEEAALTSVIQSALGHPFTVRFVWFDDALPPGRGGKFEEFRCEVETPAG